MDANDWQEVGFEANWWGMRHMLSEPHHKILWQLCFSNKLAISFDIDHAWTKLVHLAEIVSHDKSSLTPFTPYLPVEDGEH